MSEERDEKLAILEHDCRIMAAWFKELIEDEYPFSEEDFPAYTAALKYIKHNDLVLTVRTED